MINRHLRNLGYLIDKFDHKKARKFNQLIVNSPWMKNSNPAFFSNLVFADVSVGCIVYFPRGYSALFGGFLASSSKK